MSAVLNLRCGWTGTTCQISPATKTKRGKMGTRAAACLGLAVLVTCVCASAVTMAQERAQEIAQELVRFDSAPVRLGQLQQRLARERSEAPKAPDTIEGYRCESSREGGPGSEEFPLCSIFPLSDSKANTPYALGAASGWGPIRDDRASDFLKRAFALEVASSCTSNRSPEPKQQLGRRPDRSSDWSSREHAHAIADRRVANRPNAPTASSRVVGRISHLGATGDRRHARAATPPMTTCLVSLHACRVSGGDPNARRHGNRGARREFRRCQALRGKPVFPP